jgi:Fe-S cluster biosynthesis and repair protein YggX
MDEIRKAIIHFFDLEDAKKETQEDFLEDVGEVVMNSILNKAWSELGSKDRATLTLLLKESADNPEDVHKREVVLSFLDDNMANLYGFIEKELEALQVTYREYRDELRDVIT